MARALQSTIWHTGSQLETEQRAGIARSWKRLVAAPVCLRPHICGKPVAHWYAKPQCNSFARKRYSTRAGPQAANRSAQEPADDLLLSYLSKGKEVSVLGITGTNLVRDMVARHKTSPTASAALGRALMGTLLLGAAKGQKGGTVQITWLGNGPLGQMTTVGNGSGQVKGFVANPSCSPPPKNGKLDVGAAVGQGVLSVVLNHPSWQAPYTGMVPIHTGEVAEDIAMYLVDSEQTNCAIGLGVLVDVDGSVRAAGGWMIQVLPNASEETLSQLEKNVASLPTASTMASEGWSAGTMTHALLEGIGIEEKLVEISPKYGPCGVDHLRPRMVRAVASLGKEELEKAQEEGKLEVVCEFCREAVDFGVDDLQDIIQKIVQHEKQQTEA